MQIPCPHAAGVTRRSALKIYAKKMYIKPMGYGRPWATVLKFTLNYASLARKQLVVFLRALNDSYPEWMPNKF